MKPEIEAASTWWKLHIASQTQIPQKKLKYFRGSLLGCLRQRYKDHWYPEQTLRGQV